MRSPADMDVIQIIGNSACGKKCSNCTRGVPHFAADKHFEMDLPTFERAVKSMDGWGSPGKVLGLFGSEVTLHSQFESIALKFAELWGGPLKSNGVEPIKDFNAYANERLFDRSGNEQGARGLWTSLGNSYYRHYEIIQAVFGHQNINDHAKDRTSPGHHQAMFIHRDDYCKQTGTTSDEWEAARDRCPIQNTWSASVSPFGCHFCECAGAIDILLFGGKHAWPIEKGWWQRKPEDFADQLHLCNYCSLAQKAPYSVDTDERDIISEKNLVQLQLAGSPAVKKGIYDLYGSDSCSDRIIPADKKDHYLEDGVRVSQSNCSTKPRKLSGVIVCVGRAEHLATTLPHNAPLFDELVVVTTPDDLPTQSVVHERDGARLVFSDRLHHNDAAFNKAALLNEGLSALTKPDWIVLTDADVFLNHKLREFVLGHALNPGVLYGTQRFHVTEEQWQSDTSLMSLECSGDNVDAEPNGFFQLFHPRALAIRDRWPKVLPEDFCSAGGVDSWLLQQYPVDKRVMIPETPVLHLEHGEFGVGWNGSPEAAGPQLWRQIGMFTPHGMIVTEQPDFTPTRLKLTDTLYGNTCEIGVDESPPLEIRADGGMNFMGQDINTCHVHVAAKP